jgi:hypothetical protein
MRQSLRSFFLLLSLCFSPLLLLAQDVQTNPPDNFGNKGNSTTQSETNHAITSVAILAAWNDSSQIGTLGATGFQSLIGWRTSATGASFTGGGFFTLPGSFQSLGDPAVVADSTGHFYIASLASPSTGGGSLANLAAAATTGTTAPFSFATAVILAPITAGDELDKELMAIDATGGTNNDRIYLVATEFPSERIIAAHTTSLSPLTFSSFQFISATGSTGSMPAVAPNGDVYVVWTSGGNTLQMVKSANGGSNFINPDSADPAAAKTIATFTTLPFLATPAGPSVLKTAPFAQMAIDSTATGSPTRGFIYVAFAATPPGGGTDHTDIFFTRSTDGGVTWQTPRDISSGLAATIGQDTTTNDNWMPSITVSPVNGHIYITYYDRRDDPMNMLVRVYRSLSTDGGLTFANAPLGASQFTPIAGFSEAGASNNYWGEYNWSTADTNGLHFTWGDSHNTCVPPGGATSPCSPSGRPDLDAYYHAISNLSGADLFIQPWGAVTGLGPAWQTPDIFVVDGAGTQVNAFKGIINHLRAHVRNLGNASANSVTIRFKYAPIFAGLNESMMKQIGTVSLNFSAAAGGSDSQIAAIDWDLTDLTDTNGGLWPAPISTFDHFCVQVWVEFASDINLSNNFAQNNFFDVTTSAAPGNSPLSFLIFGPEKERQEFSEAQVVISKLPEGFRASVAVKGVDEPQKGFRIRANEARLAEIRFLAPREYKSEHDVVADVTLLLNGKPQGGLSALLYRSHAKQPDLHGLGPVTRPYWEVKYHDKVKPIVGQAVPEKKLPPPRTIPAHVKNRRTFPASYDKVFEAITRVLKEQKQGPSVANLERGLINTRGIQLTEIQVREHVVQADAPQVKTSGYAIVSFWLQPMDGKTEVGVDALIAIDDEAESPLGRVLRSNHSLENLLLEEVTRLLR